MCTSNLGQTFLHQQISAQNDILCTKECTEILYTYSNINKYKYVFIYIYVYVYVIYVYADADADAVADAYHCVIRLCYPLAFFYFVKQDQPSFCSQI